MKLDPFERKALVPHAHDFILIGPGDDFELVGQRAGLDHQAVIAGRLERIGKAAIDAATVVVNERRLAVHDPAGPDDPWHPGHARCTDVPDRPPEEGTRGANRVIDLVGNPQPARACKGRAR